MATTRKGLFGPLLVLSMSIWVVSAGHLNSRSILNELDEDFKITNTRKERGLLGLFGGAR